MRRPLAQPIPFARYRLVERIGHGGMATVYRATIAGPAGFERDIVVKMMLPQLADNPAFVEMFMNEAKLAARLAHPNIAQVHELGMVEGTVFIAMEYVDGIDLADLLARLVLKDARLPIPAACFIVREIADALAYAHATVNLVHRDVSPSNVMLGRDGSVKLVDFGIAKLIEEGVAGRTQSGTLKGKYGYMAPEQAAGKAVDHRSDVFASGIVLHELLTGRRLFKAESDLLTLRQVCEARAAPPSHANPSVPAELDAIVLRALAREPADRFQSASDFSEALGQLEMARRISRPKFAELVGRYCATRPSAASLAEKVSSAEMRLILGGGGAVSRPRRSWLLAAAAGLVTLTVGAVLLGERKTPPHTAVIGVTGPGFTPSVAQEAAPRATEIVVSVDSVPPGAGVRRADDGAALGTTPLVWKTPRDTGRVTLHVSKAGFREADIQTQLDRDSRLFVTLTAEAPQRPRVLPAAPLPKPVDLKGGDLIDPFRRSR